MPLPLPLITGGALLTHTNVSRMLLLFLSVDSVRFPVPPALTQAMGAEYLKKLEAADVSVCFERGNVTESRIAFTYVVLQYFTYSFIVLFPKGGKLASSADGKLHRTTDGPQGKEFLELRVREPLALVVTAYRKPGEMQYQVRHRSDVSFKSLPCACTSTHSVTLLVTYSALYKQPYCAPQPPSH